MHLVDLAPDDARVETDALPVLRELRPHLTAESVGAVYREGHPQGLRMSAVYIDDACVGVASWRIVANMVAIRKLYVDDLVTTESARSQGVGRFLLTALFERARQADCVIVDLDSGLERADAHRFYLREGFDKTSIHFAKLVDQNQPRSS